MKKNLLMMAVFMMSLPVFAAVQVVTKGNGKTYSFQVFSTIEQSGVSVKNGEYIVLNDITVAEGDSFVLDDNAIVRLGDGVTIRIEGNVSMKLDGGTLVTRNLDSDKPKGFILASTSADTIECCNLSMEYAAMKCVIASHMNIYDCSFKFANGAMGGGGALTLGTTGATFTVSNTEFISNTVPAIGCSANIIVGLKVTSCNFEDNNCANTNKPQINLTVGGKNNIEIRDCIIMGAKRNMVGGIGVSNFINFNGINNIIIEGNTIKHNRFGIGATNGMMNLIVKNNQIIDNKYEDNPMNGGSGISIYDVTGEMKLYAEGNTIDGHFWGISLIGCKSANLGKTDDPGAADYNPGKNVFRNNGNNNILYDLFNNGPYIVYAQGNTWNVDEQTAEKIETVISHKVDDSRLGEVIFMPGGTGGVESLEADKICFNSVSKQISGLESCEFVDVCSASGALVAKCPVVDGIANLENIPAGFYIVNAGQDGILKIRL